MFTMSVVMEFSLRLGPTESVDVLELFEVGTRAFINLSTSSPLDSSEDTLLTLSNGFIAIS